MGTSPVRSRSVLAPVAVAALIASLLVSVVPARAAATLMVPEQYATIAAAVSASVNGDVIDVAPGVYTGAVTLTKSVTIRGRAPDATDPRNNTTILDGSGRSLTPITVGTNVLPGPTITGLVIRNGDDGVAAKSPVTIDHTWFSANVDNIDLGLGGGGWIHHNVFQGALDDAVDIDHLLRAVTVEHNRILSSTDDGIEMRLQDDTIATTAVATFRANDITGVRDGIQVIDYYTDTNRRIVIEGNLIHDVSRAAIGLLDNEVTVEDYRAASIRERIEVVHNTLLRNNHGISGGDNLVAINNIVAGHVVGMKNVDAGSIASRNLFWNNTTHTTGSNVEFATIADPLLDAASVPAAREPRDRRRVGVLQLGRRRRHGPAARFLRGRGAGPRLEGDGRRGPEHGAGRGSRDSTRRSRCRPARTSPGRRATTGCRRRRRCRRHGRRWADPARPTSPTRRRRPRPSRSTSRGPTCSASRPTTASSRRPTTSRSPSSSPTRPTHRPRSRAPRSRRRRRGRTTSSPRAPPPPTPTGTPRPSRTAGRATACPIAGQTASTLSLATAGHGDEGDAIAVEVTASDGEASSAPLTSAPVTVADSPPVFAQDLGARSDVEGASVSVSAAATDADGEAIAYTASGLPPGVGIDPNTGLIGGTIAAGAAAQSPYAVTVTLVQGAVSGPSDTFSWTVTAAAASGDRAAGGRDRLRQVEGHGRRPPPRRAGGR